MLKSLAKQVLPAGGYERLRAWHNRPTPVRWGSLRRTEPVSRRFGLDRGTPIDRIYIERFLQTHPTDIRGRVLEVAQNTYTQRFGGAAVSQSDILHVEAGAKGATIIGDLATGRGIPAATFDAIILTQTLGFIFDIHGAVRNLHAALKPGGVVLATCAGITPISRYDMDRWGDYWRFTSLCLTRLFGATFGPAQVSVTAYGNALSATAFLQGVAAEELTPAELDATDRDYELILGVRARKSAQENKP